MKEEEFRIEGSSYGFFHYVNYLHHYGTTIHCVIFVDADGLKAVVVSNSPWAVEIRMPFK